MSSTRTDAVATSSIPLGLLVASTLSWLLGILVFGSGLTMGIPFQSVPGGGLTVAVTAGSVGLAFCYAGYGLRKRWRSAGSAALLAAIVFITLRLITTSNIGLVQLIAGAVIVLVTIHWKQL